MKKIMEVVVLDQDMEDLVLDHHEREISEVLALDHHEREISEDLVQDHRVEATGVDLINNIRDLEDPEGDPILKIHLIKMMVSI
jgi:hypothetical protein